jgi:hypothetical protein
MDSISTEDTMSVASNDAFEDSREDLGMPTFGGDSSDDPSIDETTGLPAAFSNEIIPRLDRLIQLMEALLNRPTGESPSAVLPMVTSRNADRTTGKIKNEKRATRRRSQSIREKAKTTFFKNTDTKDYRSHGQSTREKYNAAQRKRSNKSTPCWTKKGNLYDEDDSYRVGAVWPTAIHW